MTNFERRCRRLLRAYPANYRAVRGEEIVDTLMAAHADLDRPPLREAFALVLGGLRARATANRRLPALTNLRLAALFGFIVFLFLPVVRYMSYSITRPAMVLVSHNAAGRIATVASVSFDCRVFDVVAFAGTAATIAMARSGRRWWMAGTASIGVAGFVLGAVFHRPDDFMPFANATPSVIALVAIVMLMRATNRLPRPWLWLLLALGLHAAVPYHWSIHVLLTILFVTPIVLILAWITVDARPAIGLAIYFALAATQDEILFRISGESSSQVFAYVPTLIALGLLVPALFRIRRQRTL